MNRTLFSEVLLVQRYRPGPAPNRPFTNYVLASFSKQVLVPILSFENETSNVN